MPEVESYKPGTFCWAEAMTNNDEAAKAFYAELFGWTAESEDVPQGGTYTIYNQAGRSVAGSFGMSPEQRDQGVPPNWNSHISVADVDASTAEAESLGAEVVQEPFDVMSVGRMSVIKDPGGAVVSFWQPKDHKGAELLGEPVSMCWNELATRDVGAAKTFYGDLLGWTAETEPMGPMEYTTFKAGEEMRGGAVAMNGNFPPNTPPHWLTYFAVENADASTNKAVSLGANALIGPQDVPGVGRFTVLADPQGAVFGIIALAAE